MPSPHSRPTTGAAAPASAALAPSRRRSLVLGGVTSAALLWAGAATWYIAFRDEFAQTFLARQTEMRFAYEDRLAQLKDRLEREISSGLVERTAFSARVESLVKRQGEIEARQAWITQLAERLGAGPVPGVAVTSPRPEVATTGRPETTGSITPMRPVDRPAPIADEPLNLRLRGQEVSLDPKSRLDRISAVEGSLRRVADTAYGVTDALRRDIRERATRLRVALEGTRLPLPKTGSRATGGTGGPLVPLPDAFDAAGFAPLAQDVEASLSELENLADAARALPLGRPLAQELEQTSGFGYRLDPFTRGAALHTGLDFRAEPGAAVRATASGRVTLAEATGGYGNMVEVEHEGGVATRYAHLSAMGVTPGQRVEAGQVVGRAGSTGRSTGTHLHYETRIDGEPVNPSRFLDAGRILARGR